MGLNNFMLNCEKDNEALRQYIKYYKNYNQRLLKENQKYKEVIDKAKIELEKGITFCKNDSQGVYDKCNIAIKREQSILDILKEAE